MDIYSSFGFIDVIVAIVGVYGFYSWYMLVKKHEIKKTLLIGGDTNPAKCKDIDGFADFMGEKFIVNKNVLIPRDETEILVRKSIEIINQKHYKNALDIGTGSGCIACMIAKNTDCQILGVDISSDALHIALDNASKLNLYNKAIFRKSDIYSKIRETFDIIISNPPYIPRNTELQKEVQFDPELALFANDDKGLEFYKRISENAPLNKNGCLIFELGINQSEDVKNIMTKNGFKNIEIIKDLAGIDRVILGYL